MVGKRGPYDHVGEMAAIQPTQKRSATLTATEDAIVAKLSEADVHELGSRYPDIYKNIARELARRLMQRNALINAYHETIRVFIISSVEALPIARVIQNAFQHDPFLTKVWTDGVFRIANYTLQDLEAEIDNSDFAIAIAHSDDLTESRGKDWPSPRDNVIFELGLFMGRLGRARAVLMEPREERVKLPSDLSGITTIPYRFEKGADAVALLAPACNALRDHILALGPNN
jgi:predicted nucleotide-binding protein